MPSSHVAFWKKKFKQNVERDQKNEAALKALGWNVIIIWECMLQNPDYIKKLPSLLFNSPT